MEPRKLIIFTAVRIETQAIAKTLRCPHPNWPPVELHTIGIRAVHLPALPHLGTIAVIMAGLAGALDPTLRIGDVVIDQHLLAPVFSLCNKDAWVTNPSHGGVIRHGRIHTAQRLITTPADKADLFRQTGALVVDMENAIVRAAANAAGVPFIGIRAVSDTADQALDPAVLDFVDDLGRPRAAAIAFALLRRPGLIGDLHHLGAASHLAAGRLAEAVGRVLNTDFFATVQHR